MKQLPVRGAGVRDLGLVLPPARMPLMRHGRPLKRWRYVGVYGPDLMLCVGAAHVGFVPQSFWAIAEPGHDLRERTVVGRGGVRLEPGLVSVRSRSVRIDLALDEHERGMEIVSPSGRRGYIWTRKQGGVPARGRVEVDGRVHEVEGEAFVDESAGYHERHTVWKWSAGVGRGGEGERISWNLVTGVHDAEGASERTVWVDGEEREVGPVEFAPDLSRVDFAEGGALEFEAGATRENHTNLGLLRSKYRQPFGEFRGELPGGVQLAVGWGVMEEHDTWW